MLIWNPLTAVCSPSVLLQSPALFINVAPFHCFVWQTIISPCSAQSFVHSSTWGLSARTRPVLCLSREAPKNTSSDYCRPLPTKYRSVQISQPLVDDWNTHSSAHLLSPPPRENVVKRLWKRHSQTLNAEGNWSATFAPFESPSKDVVSHVTKSDSFIKFRTSSDRISVA